MKTKFIVTIILSIYYSAFSNDLDKRFFTAGRQSDTTTIKEIANELQGKTSPSDIFLHAKCYWVLQLSAFSIDNKKAVSSRGKEGLKKLDDAEKAGADPVSVLAHRAFIMQLLSSQGITSGATWGPRSADITAQLVKQFPTNYYTRYVRSINLLESPSFAGGNVAAALDSLTSLCNTYPDSLEPRMHRARALGKNRRKKEGREEVEKVLAKYPSNLFAQKVLRDID